MSLSRLNAWERRSQTRSDELRLLVIHHMPTLTMHAHAHLLRVNHRFEGEL